MKSPVCPQDLHEHISVKELKALYTCLGIKRQFFSFFTNYHIKFTSVRGAQGILGWAKQNPFHHRVWCVHDSLFTYKSWGDNLLFTVFSGYYASIPGSCNFETQNQEWTTVCGLTQDPSDDFDWNISNSAVTGQKGPDADHTPGIDMSHTTFCKMKYSLNLKKKTHRLMPR